MTSHSSSSSFPDNDDEPAGPKRNTDDNIGSIDYSLDAIENQLSSIALKTSIDGERPSVADDHHELLTETAKGSSREIESERPINSTGESNLSTETGVWRNSSEVEVDGATSSPCSSGYAGEMGTSSGTASASGADDVQQHRNSSSSEGNNGEVLHSAQSQWVPGKRHVDEDDTCMSWRQRKKHFFVLSHSGKPIFSRYGNEHKLAGFSATLQAIISFVEDGGDRVHLVRAGKHQVVFLVKGPIYLVCISCTEEPYESLQGQLELLHGQMVLILTKSVNRCFEKNPKFDMTPLLGGTDAVFSSLFHSFSWNPASFLHAYTCLPLPCTTRQAAAAILQDVSDSGVIYAMLMCKYKVVSLVGAQKAPLHPDDLLLLANFIMSSESFRTSESFSPICLPRYNSMAFLHAYIYYFDVDTYLVLLTSNSDAFFHLKDCRIRIETVLLHSNVLSDIQRSISEGGMHVENLPLYPSNRYGSLFHTEPKPHETSVGTGGPGGLWHFIYRSMNLDQYISSQFSSPITNYKNQKRLYRAYQKLHASMHHQQTGPHKTQFKKDDNYVLLCWVTQEFELYAAFDPLADKGSAIKICNRLYGEKDEDKGMQFENNFNIVFKGTTDFKCDMQAKVE
ncbi:hypothetical protein LXL04_013044 [Taraxacum kok-saghyz]